MAVTSSKDRKAMLTIGAQAPDFSLPDVVTGKAVSLSDFAPKKAFLLIILCRHCPFVQCVKDGITQFGKDYADKDLGIVAISSNDAKAYPEDAPDKLKKMAVESGFTFPVLYDETQEAAKAYTAVATPDFFLFDQNRKLVYRGQFDAARPGNAIPATGEDLRKAADALLGGQPVSAKQKPSVGCSIKWKKGNEPAYF